LVNRRRAKETVRSTWLDSGDADDTTATARDDKFVDEIFDPIERQLTRR
jgi:hypothetical protein